MGQPTVLHNFLPPDHPVQLPHSAQDPYQILTDAHKHLCEAFPVFGTREEMRDNIDARCLLMSARESVLRECVGELPPHDGNLIGSLTGLVEEAEKK